MTNLPIVGITLGDICGIGPEITAHAMMEKNVYRMCKPLVVGNIGAVKRGIEISGLALQVNAIRSVKDALFEQGTIDVFDIPGIDITKAPLGQVSAEGGKAAYLAVAKVIELAMSGDIQATVTNPLNKEALHSAGYTQFAGHTEIYAKLTNTSKYTMMLILDGLRVVHVSTHVSLRKACDLVKKERVFDVICLADKACRDLGITKPKIAVAGLNPHAGEHGLFGKEEIDEIIPAVKEAKGKGMQVEGPLPPDTIFSKALGGWYDIVVVMYHDQGHIPVKVLGFQYDKQKQAWSTVTGVNITLGLPIIRVSVDHGTAFDQAGKNTASCESLINAIVYASKFAMSQT